VVPTRWENGAFTDLRAGITGFGGGFAQGVNNRGTIVGAVQDSTGSYRPFVYDQGMTVWTDTGEATAINDSNDIIGHISSGTGNSFLFHDGIRTLLGVEVSPLGINSRCQVVGSEEFGGGSCKAFLWENGNLSFLEPDGELAVAINDSGIIVGCTSSSAVKWVNRVIIDLNTCIPKDCGAFLRYAIDINNKGEILGYGHDIGAAIFVYYLLVPDSAKIEAPKGSDTWIAGEQDTIRWRGIAKGVSLLIEYSSDDGQTYQAIAGNIPADSGKYVWDIPKDILSAKCYVRLRDNSTLDTLAVSEKFKVKPYMITQMDPSGDFRQYDIGRDRWGYGNTRAEIYPMSWYSRFNYRGIDPFTGGPYDQYAGNEVFHYAVPADFPDWVSFMNTFTINACYWNIAQGIYSQTALDRWAAIKGSWGGSCFGIATSNALAFERKADFLSYFPQYPTFNEAIAVASDTNTIPVVNEVFTHQFGNPHAARRNAYNPWPTETLSDLKSMFRKDNVPVQVLSFWNNSGSGGHSIIAYKLQRVAGLAGLFNLRVYDNSYPADTSAHIVIDSAANGGKGTWSYSNWSTWGGTKWFMLEDSAGAYLQAPTLPKTGTRTSPFLVNSSELQVLTRTGASVVIEDHQGKKTGFSGDTIMTEIPGSVPLVIKNGSETPPYGYMLPVGSYSLQMSSFSDSVARMSLSTGNKTCIYERHGATQQQSDRLLFDSGVSVINPDPDTKPITLQSIINNTTDEKVFLVRSLALSQNDSVRMETVDEEKLKLTSIGTAKSYKIGLDYATETALGRFQAAGVPLVANSSHLIVPNWTDVVKSELTILVDAGNDGTVDDTLHLKNELTGADEHGSLIPGEYRLYQNYPNPFNPSTTIRYGLPHKSAVQLTVFNTLGQLVATLVEGEQEAGYHEVKFDASGLSSGVCFYRLKAGDFVQTRKLLLLR
jgi:hypothetical protein